VGGVSERAGAKAGGSNPFARSSFASYGERHPGLLEGGALRGASSERGPRSVRERAVVSSIVRKRAGDSGCPKVAEEGNVVGIRGNNAYAPGTGTRDRRMRSGTRPSLGPSTRARRSSLCTAGAIPGGGAFEVASRLGKPAQAGGTSTGAIVSGRSAARRVSPLPQGRGRGTREKDGGRGLPPCEDTKSSGLVARTSIVVAEVGRRRLASNKLGRRAPKRAAGSSEQGSSSPRSSVGDTIGGDGARNGQSQVGLSPPKAGEDRQKAQGGERSPSSGRTIARA
jgi:hypothetical protein